MVNLFRINKFGAKKENSEEDSVVELTSCIIEVMSEVISSGYLMSYIRAASASYLQTG